MTKQEVNDIIESFQLRSYHVTVHEDGNCILRFGDDDPMETIKRLKMDMAVMKTQIRKLMSMAYGMDFEKAEELIK